LSSADLPGDEDANARAAAVEARLHDNSFTHWTGFSIIIVSANVVAAIALLGTIIDSKVPSPVRAVGILMAIGSLAAAMVAYFSIQVGATLSFGPLSLRQVGTSMLIAGSQLCLFLARTNHPRTISFI
jgi:hypothetical protein